MLQHKRRPMKLFRMFLFSIVVSAAALCEAQQTQEWIPQGIEALRQSASSKTEFTLDHSMLVLAAKLDSGNEDLLRVIAGVKGLSVHRYRFQDPWGYDLAMLGTVKDEYNTQGWMQLMKKHDRDGGPGASDLWIHWQNDAISNVAILLTRPNEVTFIEVSGSISPLDLTRLGGHFGIPKIEGGVRVPNAGRR